MERADDDRVLFSYDVGRETKVAFIAADGIRDWNEDEGWGIESWAQCDPAELPAAVTAGLDIQVWERNGHRVPVSKITSFPGSEHCDWQDIMFLTIGPYGDENPASCVTRTGELDDYLRTTFDARPACPTTRRTPASSTTAGDCGWPRTTRAAYLVSTSRSTRRRALAGGAGDDLVRLIRGLDRLDHRDVALDHG